MVRDPLLIPAAGFAAGILAASLAPLEARHLVSAGCALGAVTVFAFARSKPALGRCAVLCAMMAAGALAFVWRTPTQPPELDADDGETLILAGCVVDPPLVTEDRERFTLELAPGARVAVSVFLKEGEVGPKLDYGQQVEFDARVRKPRNYANPGAFNYAAYLSRQSVYWTASVRADTAVKTLPGFCGSRLQAAIFRLRVAALDRIEKLYAGDAYACAMTEAVLIGETRRLEKVWTEVFRRTGTYHALVISGMHVAVLAGALLFLLRLCMLNELAALLIAAIAAWLYAAVSGWSAPVVRAAGGFTLYLAARFMGRKGRVINLVSAVALVYLAWDPLQLFDASFQLSFLCVISIGAFAAPLTDWALGRYRAAGSDLADRTRDPRLAPIDAAIRVELRLLVETIAVWTGWPSRNLYPIVQRIAAVTVWVASMVILSTVIQLALALPMALYFHRLSVTGVTANLIVVPAMNLMVPTGFAAIFTGFGPLAWLARVCIKVSAAVAGWHAQFEPARRIPDPPLWLALALAASLVLLAVAVRIRSRWILPAVAASVLLLAVLIAAPFAPETRRGVLELSALDVGQGEGMLLVTPDGKVLLIDAGGFPPNGSKRKPSIDIGEDVISPYLWTRRIQRADVIVTTHAHEDHVGGLAALVANFRPSEIWTGYVPAESVETEALNTARAAGVKVRAPLAGERFSYGGAEFEILAPFRDHIADERRLNNDSLAIRVRYGQHTFLLTGDLEKDVEWMMLDRGELQKTTVLKVAHHGSRTSSTQEFLDATQPQFAIISAGYLNMFRLPAPDVLQRLEEHHTEILRTDTEGLVSIHTDGRRLTVETMRTGLAARTLASPFQAW